MRKHLRTVFVAVLIALIGWGGAARAADAPLPVVASFSVLGDMVKQVGGDAVDVKTLVVPDNDTHAYQPTPEDAKTLVGAKLIFVNGLGFEGWRERLVSASGTKAQLIIASAGVKSRTMIEDATEADGTSSTVIDPHAWQDLSNGRIYVRNIAEALKQALPDQAGAIQARADRYDALLARMDRYVKAELADIPASQRKVITSHDAFGYFGAAYGITFVAPEGLSTEAEPSASDVALLIEQIKAEKVKLLFIENMNSPRLIQQIARDTGAQMGGTLYSDALSPPDGPAPTYLAMFENNVPKLKSAMELNGK